ncbi:uncharacterized protein LOC9631733 [Selaginella moellendorffii]|uniref:uncharacterized protein LOC9631733 n=1 Tax=Selaginella moellendorffii TaxID=88036 RepID=UPI000D1C767E|nr:uncharacterized protein LOC9631733 [Selaginella moellendorffii]|eukprot:XP_024530846.1 uncharacterized protein LOC9631733 [Selaginella moellendorffii]
MDLEGVLPNKVTFVTVLRACTTLAQCEKIFARVKHLGLELDTTLGTAFVSTFAKLGDLAAARDVFENLGSSRNVVSWTVMIWAYAQQGFIRAAFDLYKRMDCEPNAVTFMAVMDSCLRPEDLPRAEQIHAHMVASGFESDVVLQVCLVTMYGKCGSVDSAWSIFENLKERSVVAWNSMLSAFASNGCYERSLKLYERMLLEGTKPDKITYLAVLDACQSVSEARRYAATFELELDIAARNAAVSAYARCGSLKEAKAAFDAIQWKNNAVTWNAMISGLAQHGESKQALECFWKMELEGVRANSVTYLASLEACSSLKDLTRGRQLHARILLENIHEANLSNAVINMYGKCGSLDEAMDEFVKMPERDVISWNTMIATYAQHGSGRQALEFFKQMDLEGWTPDRATYLGAIDACGSVPSLALGKTIHSIVATAAPCLEQDPGVATALVTMYARCGSLHDAKSVFWRSHSRNLVTWSNLIAACAQHGRENEALDLFREMQLQGTKPDALTFSTLVAACSRRGVVKDGVFYFVSMVEDYNIPASEDHFGGMVDLLGRAGWLEEAEQVMRKNPCALAHAVLLGACHVHGDVERGIRVAQSALELDWKNSASYVTMSHMYAGAGSRQEFHELETSLSEELGPLAATFPCLRLRDVGVVEIILEAVEEVEIAGLVVDDGVAQHLDAVAVDVHVHRDAAAHALILDIARHIHWEWLHRLLSMAFFWPLGVRSCFSSKSSGKPRMAVIFLERKPSEKHHDREDLLLGRVDFSRLGLPHLQSRGVLSPPLHSQNFAASSASPVELDKLLSIGLERLEGAHARPGHRCPRTLNPKKQMRLSSRWRLLFRSGARRLSTQARAPIVFKVSEPVPVIYPSLRNRWKPLEVVAPFELPEEAQFSGDGSDEEDEDEEEEEEQHRSRRGRQAKDQRQMQGRVKHHKREEEFHEEEEEGDTQEEEEDQGIVEIEEDHDEEERSDEDDDDLVMNSEEEADYQELARMVDEEDREEAGAAQAAKARARDRHRSREEPQDQALVLQKPPTRSPVVEDQEQEQKREQSSSRESSDHHSGSKRLEQIIRELEQQDVKFDSAAYGSLLQWCGNSKSLDLGSRVLDHMIKTKQTLDRYLLNMLVEMYGKCGAVGQARQTFDRISRKNVFSWTIMITAYAQNGHSAEAIKLLAAMDLDGEPPNVVTFVNALAACSSSRSLHAGRIIHESLAARNLDSNLIAQTALLDMYSKCSSLQEAIRVFSAIKNKDTVSYNAMISALSRQGYGKESLELFQRMELEGFRPDEVTYGSVLNACERLGALSYGGSVHRRIRGTALESDVVVATALVGLYGRCGQLDSARGMFEAMGQKGVVAWTLMISSLAQNGRGDEALDLFRRMECAGVAPDEVTLASALLACGGRRVEEGRRIFDALGRVYPVSASAEHYGCMVEVLGRAGKLEEAEGLIQGMPRKASGAIWMALLAACNRRGDLERGIRAANRAQQLDPGSFAASMAMLAELYGAAGRWEDAARVRKAVESRNARREPGGRSWIEVNNRVHEFGEDDDRLQGPRLDKIRGELQRLSSLAVEEGGICKDENARAHILGCCHSEKVAIGFGIVSTPAGQLIRIVKNLRACHDCHAFAKFVSRRIQREISVRDPYGLHCFHTNGSCSCEI